MEATKVDPEERVRHRTVAQVGNVPVPQFREQIADVDTVVLLERISWCVSSENYHKRGYYFTWSRESHFLLPRHHACPEFSWFDISISQRWVALPTFWRNLGMSCDCNLRPSGRPRKRRRRIRGRAQRPSERVVRVIGASLIVKMVKTGRCRSRHMLEAVAGILVEHRTGSAERATALTSVGEGADGIGKGSGRGKRDQASIPEA